MSREEIEGGKKGKHFTKHRVETTESGDVTHMSRGDIKDKTLFYGGGGSSTSGPATSKDGGWRVDGNGRIRNDSVWVSHSVWIRPGGDSCSSPPSKTSSSKHV